MLRVAVTGGIACGKSLVGSYLSKEGAPVCEADDLAAALMEPGQRVFENVAQAFGRGILADDGRIDRAVLAKRVFGDPEALAQLNALTHPWVKQRWEAWLNEQAEAAVVIVPLLYEAGVDKGWDAVICVSASTASQMTRLRERGLSDEAAQQRLAAQLVIGEKMLRADYVILNNGAKALLREQTQSVWRDIRESDHG